MSHNIWCHQHRSMYILQIEQQKKNISIWNQPLSAKAPTANVKSPFKGFNRFNSWVSMLMLHVNFIMKSFPMPRFCIDWMVPNAVPTFEIGTINGIIGHSELATIENDIPRNVTPKTGIYGRHGTSDGLIRESLTYPGWYCRKEGEKCMTKNAK